MPAINSPRRGDTNKARAIAKKSQKRRRQIQSPDAAGVSASETPYDVGPKHGTLLNGDAGVSTEPKSLVGQDVELKTLGRYQVLGELGRGGMGAVYLANDTKLKRKVALKIPQFESSKAEQMKVRFQREAEMAAQLTHPNICQVYDVAVIDGKQVMAMEYVAGKTLSAYTKPDKLLSERQAVQQMRKVALAVVGDATIVPRNWPREVDDQTHVPDSGNAAVSDSTIDDGATMNAPVAHRSSAVRKAASAELLPQFPGYQTVSVIGRGGMGAVYEAKSNTDGKRVAVKVISANTAATENDVERFIREAEILKELHHPNIVGFHELKKTHSDGSLFLVMDHVAGPNAEAIMKKRGQPLPVKRAIAWSMQLLDGLKYAHTQGYIHRDVKPTNILVVGSEGTETVFLADFGLARAYQTSKLSGLTMTGELGGSTPFMPPEQITNYRNVDPTADQYSAAATIYYLLTMKNVYDFPRDVAKQLLMILQDVPVPITNHKSDLPDDLIATIHKALARQPADRFADINAFQQALAIHL